MKLRDYIIAATIPCVFLAGLVGIVLAAKYNLDHQHRCDAKYGSQAEWLGANRCRVRVIEGAL